MKCKTFWPPGDLQAWGEDRTFCEGGEWGINSYFTERHINKKSGWVEREDLAQYQFNQAFVN